MKKEMLIDPPKHQIPWIQTVQLELLTSVIIIFSSKTLEQEKKCTEKLHYSFPPRRLYHTKTKSLISSFPLCEKIQVNSLLSIDEQQNFHRVYFFQLRLSAMYMFISCNRKTLIHLLDLNSFSHQKFSIFLKLPIYEELFHHKDC